MSEKKPTEPRLQPAQLSWTQEGLPFSERFSDIYFSEEGGRQEVEHVFIRHNDLEARFSALEKPAFRITETGFGSGLNFLVAAELWLQSAPAEARLHFVSFEKYPMSREDLQRAHAAFTGLEDVAAELRSVYPDSLPGWHDGWLFSGRVRLTLWFGDVLNGLPEMDAPVDAWFLDGFAPSRNPQMWQPSLFQQMARLSRVNTSFATFTSAGSVRRGLQAAGFEVRKTKGFGRKREMCCGRLVDQREWRGKAPWFQRPPSLSRGRALVVGAGLAGAAAAHKLAETGWQVTVVEAEEKPATGASGNLAGTVHPLITADWNQRSQWYLLGLEATLRTVLPWLASGEVKGDLSGLLHVAVDPKRHERVRSAFERIGLPPEFARNVSRQEATDLAGTTVAEEGVFFPRGGWLNPPSLVQRCLAHPSIRVRYRQPVEGIERQQDGWQVRCATARFDADAVVLASGALDKALNRLGASPIRPVKGQVTHLARTDQQVLLNCALTHAGYSAPCGDGRAVTGATFEAPDMSDAMSSEGHRKNLVNARQALPEWLKTNRVTSLEGRVAFRPTTPDHLPLVGPVADPEWLESAYLSQLHSRAPYDYPQQRYLPGLYVSNGHGARGLMSVFLAAETVAADLNGDALNMPLSLYYASHPARFAIRSWRSGKQGER